MAVTVAGDAGRLRIAFLTPWRVDDPRSWSGIVKPMHDALAPVADVVPISTSDVRAAPVDRVLARLSRKTYLWDFGLATSRRRGRIATRRIEQARVDVVFAVAASVDVAHLAGSVPVVQYVDAGFEDMKDEYSIFSGLSRLSTVQIRRIGRRAARRTSAYVAASQWAADGIRRSQPSADVVVAPAGAAILQAVASTPRGPGPLRVLVVSSDWRRKGGDRAVQAVERLRDEGERIELTVVGNSPQLPDWVRVRGQLSADQLSAAYAEADVLLEAARANAAGVTLTDAAAHGLKAIATDTGGVSSIVADGRSGWLVPNDEHVVDHLVERLRCLIADDSGATPDAVRAWYADELDWSHFAQRVVGLCRRVTEGAA